MFNFSDRVSHKPTGDIGIVIGYGSRIFNGNYLTTVKVQITTATTTKVGVIVEDLLSEWLFCKQESYCLFESNQNTHFYAA